MTANTVRGSLRQAYQEIEDVCENEPLSADAQNRLTGIADQLRYLVEGDARDPEALAGPDPNTLVTIRETLGDVVEDAEGHTATRLERARDEVLHAIAVLDDQVERQSRSPGTST